MPPLSLGSPRPEVHLVQQAHERGFSLLSWAVTLGRFPGAQAWVHRPSGWFPTPHTHPLPALHAPHLYQVCSDPLSPLDLCPPRAGAQWYSTKCPQHCPPQHLAQRRYF